MDTKFKNIFRNYGLGLAFSFYIVQCYFFRVNHIEKKLARVEGLGRDLGFILPVLAFVLLMTFTAVPVLAPEIISWPEGTMEVTPGENFTFRHRLRWDEDAPGYYIITIYWDYGGDNSWHFTLVENKAYFDNLDPIQAIASFTDNGSRYTIGVAATAGDWRDGSFNVDLTLCASGPDESPHRAGDHPISYIAIRCNEESQKVEYPEPVTVRVSEERPAPTAWPAVLVVLIGGAILVGGYILYSIFKAGKLKRKRKLTLRA